MAINIKGTTASSDTPSRGHDAALRAPYAAPRIEEDLPLEVMSLACSTFLPKSNLAGPCQSLGS
jgi:hypothetical protein